MFRGNPAALLWINHKAKKIWKKKYSGKEGKYKKANKEAMAAYCKKHPKKKKWNSLGRSCFFVVSTIYLLSQPSCLKVSSISASVTRQGEI